MSLGNATLAWLPTRRSRQAAENPIGTTAAPMRAAPDPEEMAWLTRARQGDVAAFDWLMNRYRDRALRLAAHVLRRPAEAEDLVQEAFLRAFAQIGQFRGESSFFTWLYRIVVRLCLNRMRTPDWRDCAWPETDVFEPTPEVETEGERSQTRLLIETLLDELSPPLRAALVLRELEGLDYEEIAETLQIPIGTVRSRLSAARLQFRALWERALKETHHV